MKTIQISVILLFMLSFYACSQSQNKTASHKDAIVELVGEEEYQRIMILSMDDFDQSNIGFRAHSNNYELTSMLIPEYIRTNEISEPVAANLHWHLGQIHAFNNNIEAAIFEMKQSSLDAKPIYWNCYVDGSVAFLERDKEELISQLELLRAQDNQMNIVFLEKFVKYWDLPYWEAYNNPL